jgi:hypothetical protein
MVVAGHPSQHSDQGRDPQGRARPRSRAVAPPKSHTARLGRAGPSQSPRSRRGVDRKPLGIGRRPSSAGRSLEGLVAAVRSAPASRLQQVQACSPCHPADMQRMPGRTRGASITRYRPCPCATHDQGTQSSHLATQRREEMNHPTRLLVEDHRQALLRESAEERLGNVARARRPPRSLGRTLARLMGQVGSIRRWFPGRPSRGIALGDPRGRQRRAPTSAVTAAPTMPSSRAGC